MKELFNKDWKIIKDNKNRLRPYLSHFCISKLEDVTLPDDQSIKNEFNKKCIGQNEVALLDGGIYWYIKDFFIDDLNKTYYIKFLAAYMNSKTYINENFISDHPNGYTPFEYDISKYLKIGKNRIAIKVENIMPSSRWYSGVGIYQDCYLYKKNKIHLDLSYTYVTTPRLRQTIKSNNIKVIVKNKIVNNHQKDIEFKVIYELLDFDKNILNTFEIDKIYQVNANSSLEIENDFFISDIKLWSLNEPNLYYIKTYIQDTSLNTLDEEEVLYGFRYLNFEKDGFYLNGIKTKINGVCLHHDNGMLGAIQVKEAIYRKLKILKEIGVNAIRSSHNMASDLLVYYCDLLGFLLLDEFSDTWYKEKKVNDYARFFEKIATDPKNKIGDTWGVFDLKEMINRDKNHPSVFMYSLGNELEELLNPDEKAVRTCKILISTVKEIDKTRPVTIASNSYQDNYNIEKDKISKLLDIVGLNYSQKNIGKILENNPDFIFLGTEISSSLKSRGVYINTNNNNKVDVVNEKNKILRDKFFLNSYGSDIPTWGDIASDSIKYYYENKNYLGDFIWTGFDYLGEPTPWLNIKNTPPVSSYFGLCDLAGLKKDEAYLYKSYWTNEPFIHILPHWNFNFEDIKKIDKYGTNIKKNIPIRVYTNLATCEIFLDDKSYGRLSFDIKKTNNKLEYKHKYDNLYLEWIIPYDEDKKIKAVGYDEKNNPIIIKNLERIKSENKINLSLDYPINDADIFFIKYMICDENNNINPISDLLVDFNLIGDGIIMAIDNGNNTKSDKFYVNKKNTKLKCFNGCGIIVIRKNKKDNVKLIAKCKNLPNPISKIIF